MRNLQRGGACLNFAYLSMQFCNPSDPKRGGGHGPMALAKNISNKVTAALRVTLEFTELFIPFSNVIDLVSFN